jgi:hypothetical protein
VLTGEHYETMRALLTDRIRWLRSLGRPEHHTAALDWCTVLHALMCENVDERSSCASLLVVQSDSLLRLHRMPEAVAVATQAWQTLPNTRTTVMRFTAIMHAEAAVNNTAKVANEEAVEAAVLALREMHRTDTTMTSAGPASAPAFTMTEQLARIILCCQMAQQSEQLPELTRDATSQRLLVEWLQLYTDHTAWRSTSTATENDAVNCLEPADGNKDKETTYFGVVCDMLHLFFKHRLSHTLRSGKAAFTVASDLQPVPSTTGMGCLTVTAPVITAYRISAIVCCYYTVGVAPAVDAADRVTSTSTPVVTARPQRDTSLLQGSQQGDLFATTGYPDCLQHLISHPRGFTFACTSAELREVVLHALEEALRVMSAVQKDNLPLTALGSLQDLSWLCNLAFNIGTLITKHPGSMSHSSEATVSICDSVESQRLVCAARLFEIAELLMEKQHGIPREPTSVVHNSALPTAGKDSPVAAAGDRALCLLVACSCRIDAEASCPTPATAAATSAPLPFASGLDGAPTARSIPSNNLVQSRLDAQKAGRLLQCGVDFDDTRSQSLQCSALLLEFDALCRLGDSNLCAVFLQERQTDFLRLAPADLKRCADTARLQGKISADVIRSLLNTALQCLMRSAAHPHSTVSVGGAGGADTARGQGCEYYALLGGVYRELIELSPTRRQALEKIEEFAQLATCGAVSTADCAGTGGANLLSAANTGKHSEYNDESMCMKTPLRI